MGIVVSVVATVSSQAGANSTTTAVSTSDSSFFPDTPAAVAFHDQMRKLWEDHVTWTRLTIVSAVGGSVSPTNERNDDPLVDLGVTLQRLQQNQDDIGAAIAPYFGEAAGNQLADLLHEHISGAVRLVLAAKAGTDPDEIAAAKETWYKNAQDIANFLAAANPRYWPLDTVSDAMRTHLDQTLQEAVDQIQHNLDAEAGDYEATHLHILHMADLLSSGIIQKFRDQFEQQ
jgi:hypothetical protein